MSPNSDDRSNWVDYEPRLQKAMGSMPKPYVVADKIPVLSNGKTPATEEQLEAKEIRMIEFEKKEYLAQHIILSTTSIHLGAKIKDLDMAEAMWKIVKANATTKSTLYCKGTLISAFFIDGISPPHDSGHIPSMQHPVCPNTSLVKQPMP